MDSIWERGRGRKNKTHIHTNVEKNRKSKIFYINNTIRIVVGMKTTTRMRREGEEGGR